MDGCVWLQTDVWGPTAVSWLHQAPGQQRFCLPAAGRPQNVHRLALATTLGLYQDCPPLLSQAVASKLDLPDDLVGYFSLFLVRQTKDGAFSCE